MKLDTFIKTSGLSATAVRVSENPHMKSDSDADARWAREASHWKVTLTRRTVGSKKRTMTVYFSMGSAHKGAPDLADVLDSLIMDAVSWENAQSFEEWARELGYDEDSRRAEKTFKAVETEAKKLKQFLGSAAYEIALWKTERL